MPRPRWTAEQLLSHRLDCRPIELYLELPPFGSKERVRFRSDVEARAVGVPLQYLLGSTEFYGREFFVGPGVFIPRPETEVLIDGALDVMGSRMDEKAVGSPVVVDVGTGSGAIAITLALELPGIRVLGIDLSKAALSFAERNRAHHRTKVTFLSGDLVSMFAPQSVHLLVANLPYLDPEGIESWPRELHWEPPLALDGGEQGLAIRRLIDQAGRVLRPDGYLLLEIGAEQAKSVTSFAGKNGFEVERVVRDLAGLDRVVALKWKS